jgi:hypothetical protein
MSQDYSLNPVQKRLIGCNGIEHEDYTVYPVQKQTSSAMTSITITAVTTLNRVSNARWPQNALPECACTEQSKGFKSNQPMS